MAVHGYVAHLREQTSQDAMCGSSGLRMYLREPHATTIKGLTCTASRCCKGDVVLENLI